MRPWGTPAIDMSKNTTGLEYVNSAMFFIVGLFVILTVRVRDHLRVLEILNSV